MSTKPYEFMTYDRLWVSVDITSTQNYGVPNGGYWAAAPPPNTQKTEI